MILPPSCNTGGVSPNVAPSTGGAAPFQPSLTTIDTFSITTLSKIKDLHTLIEQHFPGASVESGKSPRNYSHGARFVRNGQTLGWTGWGARGHGRNLMYVDGAGCRQIAKTGFERIEADLAGLDGIRYTRVDIASDTYDGQVGSQTILDAYEADGFKVGRSKKNPQLKTIESRNPDGKSLGKTIYVGAEKATKIARCYEKGLQLVAKQPAESITRAAHAKLLRSVPGKQLAEQLGDAWKDKLADWYRVEIQYRHDKDRPLSLDMLSRRDDFFAGAYPICEELLPHADPIRPAYIPDPAEIALIRKVWAMRVSYGPTVRTLLDLNVPEGTILGFIAAGYPSKKLREAGIENVEAFIDAVRRMIDEGGCS